jgi:hypothetical protein
MVKPFYYISAYLDISSLLPQTPNTEFDINVFLNKQNNLDYLNLDNIQDYTQFYTVNSCSVITDVALYSNPPLKSSNYLSNVDLTQVQLSLTDSFNRYDQGRLQCYYGENFFFVSAMDPIGRYAYFATSNFFGSYVTILKVDLVSFSVVNALNTPYEYSMSTFALIDPLGKHLYLGCRKGFGESQILRIELDTFAFSGSIEFPSSDTLFAGVIDNQGLYMYTTTTSFNPIQVSKINLVTFTIVQTLTLNPGEQVSTSVVIDNTDQYLYVAVNDNPGSVVKVDLITFTRVSTLTLSSPYPKYGLVDPSGLYIYFATGLNTTTFVKVDLSTFTETASLPIPSSSSSGVIDPLGKYIYAMIYTPGTVIQIDLNTFNVASTTIIPSSSNISCVSIDPSGLFLYAGQETDPGYIQKISLSPSISLTGSIEGRQGVRNFTCGAAEPTGEYAYIGSSLGGITKVSLPFWTVAEELGFSASVILMDPKGKYIYFDTVKVDLATQVAVASTSLGSPIYSAAIDPSGKFAYYGTDTSIVKVDLKTMTIAGTILLAGPEINAQCALMDLEGKYVYFGVQLFYSPPPPVYSRIIQIDLETFTRQAQLDLNENEDVSCAVLDQQGIFGYFGCKNLGAQIIRIQLSTLSRVATLTTLNAYGMRCVQSAVRDPNSSYAYFATSFDGIIITTPPQEKIAKIDLDLLQVIQVYDFGTQGIPTAFTTAKAPYVYFGSLDGYLVRIPDTADYLISGFSGNTPGNLVNNTTTTDIDYKSQVLKLQRKQQNLQNHYFNLRVKGITAPNPTSDPVSIHAQMKVFPQ